MAVKQKNGLYAPDSAKYGTITDGQATLAPTTTSSTGSKKQLNGSQSPDGSIYFCLVDGVGNLT